MADPSKAMDEFLGDVLADLMRAGGRRAVKQAGKAFKHGTSYRFRVGVSGTAQGEIVEDVDKRSGLRVELRPGPLVQEVTGSVGYERGTDRGINANVTGGLGWFCEVEVLNAVAIEGDADGDDLDGQAG